MNAKSLKLTQTECPGRDLPQASSAFQMRAKSYIGSEVGEGLGIKSALVNGKGFQLLRQQIVFHQLEANKSWCCLQ